MSDIKDNARTYGELALLVGKEFSPLRSCGPTYRVEKGDGCVQLVNVRAGKGAGTLAVRPGEAAVFAIKGMPAVVPESVAQMDARNGTPTPKVPMVVAAPPRAKNPASPPANLPDFLLAGRWRRLQVGVHVEFAGKQREWVPRESFFPIQFTMGVSQVSDPIFPEELRFRLGTVGEWHEQGIVMTRIGELYPGEEPVHFGSEDLKGIPSPRPAMWVIG